MQYITYDASDQYPVAILIRGMAFNKRNILQHYVQPSGIEPEHFIAVPALYNEHGKAPAGFIRDYLATLLPELNAVGVKYLYVVDGPYFKILAKQQKVDTNYGYVHDCAVPGFEHMKVVVGVSYQALVYNPDLKQDLGRTLAALHGAYHGAYIAPGSDIIHSASYPTTASEAAQALQSLHQYKELSMDIEAFSLRFQDAGIGSIGFAWDKHNGIALRCDYAPYPEQQGNHFGCFKPNYEVRKLLKRFFETYQGKMIWHNAAYDLRVIIYTLWMSDPLDTAGLLDGLEVMSRHVEDTQIIAYLALNSTAEIKYALKALAQEFAGNWAVEVKDIRTVPLDKLLQYNLVDCLSTFYVYEKYTPMMVQDNQEELYRTMMLPTLKMLIQTELTGMPMRDHKIKIARQNMEALSTQYMDFIAKHPLVKALNVKLQISAMEAANAKLKVKQHPLEKFADVVFNPGSDQQLRRLLYEQMKLPVLEYTKTKLPSVKGKVIGYLTNHTEDPSHKELLKSIVEYLKVNKILSTFISAFERGMVKDDGTRYLHGNFNIGGTVSGRLSSSGPNLQNIPTGDPRVDAIVRWVLECFGAPSGWLMVGADFNSLEDMVSALTTKDPNKLKVYLDGYDGHSLRAYSYFPDLLPDIENTVESINSIETKYPEVRQDSKAPTFLLTYRGTYHGLMRTLGWTEEKAKEVEANYHDLYKVSDQYVQDRLVQASKDGYVEVAFGLRLRTPLLHQVVWGSSSVPYAAMSESRTAGNALGQSYGLLNNRAAVEFMNKVWNSKYRYCIKPIALIHDAIYLMVRNDADVVEWVNRELIKSMQWQELPELQHDQVKLGAELDIFYPDWSNPITIPNEASRDEIIDICNLAHSKLKEAA